MNKILEIEGLRGFLALWVVFDHLMVYTGYSYQQTSGLFRLLRSGWYAVDIFIILSGFVIFYLLDSKKENYLKYITRRFFRIYPLFIILFFVSIPILNLELNNIIQLKSIYPNGDFDSIINVFRSVNENSLAHVILHLFMVHGVVPDNLLPYSPGAFLGPAWSISLEWQFYLLAPVFFNWWCKNNYKIVLVGFIVILSIVFRNHIPFVQHGAFLPFHIEYFFIGMGCYYIWKNSSKTNNLLLIGLTVSTIFIFSSFNRELIPLIIWIPFFCFILDKKNMSTSILHRTLSVIFNNKMSLYIGKISYSIYLSHVLVIYLITYITIDYTENFTRKEYLILLSLIVIPTTLLISALLYRFVEKPAIIKGNTLAKKL